MAEDWTAIASEIAEALGEVSALRGWLHRPGGYSTDLLQPVPLAATPLPVTLVRGTFSFKERETVPINQADVLYLVAAGEAPNDEVDTSYLLEVEGDTQLHKITNVWVVKPADIPLTYRIHITGTG